MLNPDKIKFYHLYKVCYNIDLMIQLYKGGYVRGSNPVPKYIKYSIHIIITLHSINAVLLLLLLFYCYYYFLRTNYNVESPEDSTSISFLSGRISNRCKTFERYSLSPKTWAETPENMQTAKYLL